MEDFNWEEFCREIGKLIEQNREGLLKSLIRTGMVRPNEAARMAAEVRAGERGTMSGAATPHPLFRFEAFDFPKEQVQISCPQCFALTRAPLAEMRGVIRCQTPSCTFCGMIEYSEEAERQTAGRPIQGEVGRSEEIRLHVEGELAEDLTAWHADDAKTDTLLHSINRRREIIAGRIFNASEDLSEYHYELERCPCVLSVPDPAVDLNAEADEDDVLDAAIDELKEECDEATCDASWTRDETDNAGLLEDMPAPHVWRDGTEWRCGFDAMTAATRFVSDLDRKRAIAKAWLEWKREQA